ncbi:hypothetical protein COCSUDRAFT_43828 [Coccomyxa subellipsoidea C-169]|uniref:Uncharacterized protein n=1 Tax=Coccomyxa subellipsoidea (strain C-169) TaxID=574566 RepID=I0YPP6_COCSC|nr:hypothetical protein COCSUDRAFT_43828 [Coccomyxa subellipsoidea C-169]EIE20365.1 hypothetical protein COCSUDRAFT_43828 [Coccomyxa subellipsoidea C-169]|eukprot:XP_005644909.1 hypothetical protein COCSUDRAFT_43828 [Coccomyxa subellipsoidea C-169]
MQACTFLQVFAHALLSTAAILLKGASFLQYVFQSYAKPSKAFHEGEEHTEEKPRPTLSELLTTPLSEVVQKDGSIESFQELLEDIANPTSLATFDPEMFKASLEGVGIEATIISFAPCLVRNGIAGVSLENSLISIIPELIKIAPTGVNVEPTLINISPQLIDIGPRGVIAEAAGIAIENRLIDIAPGGRSDAFLP